MPSSKGGGDAVLMLRRVCCHGICFRYGAQLKHPPYNRLRPPDRDPKEGPGPTLYRLIQAASPPPSRRGKPWQEDIRADGEPFDPDDTEWRKKKDISALVGIPSLDPPAPRTMVLSEWCRLPFGPGRMRLREGDEGPEFFPSARYVQPNVDPVDVNYYLDAYCRHWDRRLDPDDWVAISFDRFWPPWRDSVEFITQVGECSQGNCILHQLRDDPDQAAAEPSS